MSTPSEIWQQIEREASAGRITLAALRPLFARATGWLPPEPFALELPPQKPKKGAIPTLEEWTGYGAKLSPAFPLAEAIAAFDHYEANGWKQSNGNRIIDWQATCRNSHRFWLTKRGPAPATTLPNGFQRPPRAI